MTKSWCWLHRTCFYTSWSLRHPARDVSPIIWTDYTRYSEPLPLETFPKASYRMQLEFLKRNISTNWVLCFWDTAMFDGSVLFCFVLLFFFHSNNPWTLQHSFYSDCSWNSVPQKLISASQWMQCFLSPKHTAQFSAVPDERWASWNNRGDFCDRCS